MLDVLRKPLLVIMYRTATAGLAGRERKIEKFGCKEHYRKEDPEAASL